MDRKQHRIQNFHKAGNEEIVKSKWWDNDKTVKIPKLFLTQVYRYQIMNFPLISSISINIGCITHNLPISVEIKYNKNPVSDFSVLYWSPNRKMDMPI